jgi:DNA-binding CsgD family transcriptional regulator
LEAGAPLALIELVLIAGLTAWLTSAAVSNFKTEGRQLREQGDESLHWPHSPRRWIPSGHRSARPGDSVAPRMELSAQLQEARASFDRHDWPAAHTAFSQIDARQPLGADDLRRLATAAYLVGQEREFQRHIERAHRAHVEAGEPERAARDAFWLALTCLLRGDVGQANAWSARGEKLVQATDCAERGYLLLPAIEQLARRGDIVNAQAMSAKAAAIGERFHEPDLLAATWHMQGRMFILSGEVPPGMKLLDDTMLAAVAGETSPIMTGLLYCSVIGACCGVCDFGRAREWTLAMARWCERQSGMVSFTDTCLVHRAEILQLQGDWHDALAQARSVCERCERSDRQPPGAAHYQLAEVHRLRGEAADAEREYHAASGFGHDPQPGLALLRLAQGRTDAATAALRRALGTTRDQLMRARLLPAHIEIVLSIGDVEEARLGCQELEDLHQHFGTDVFRALGAHWRGALLVATGEPHEALGHLRRAFECWQQLAIPYEAARVRALIGAACRDLGDEEAGLLEIAAARAAFEALGARPAIERLNADLEPVQTTGPLSPRELEVLRLVAEGRTNKRIALALHLSERTIDRHVSNILAKLDVPSRAAATAFALSRRLF